MHGAMKLRRTARKLVERHASSGPDSGEEDEEEADGRHHAVVEGRVDGGLGAVPVLGEHGEERSPENGEAGQQQDQVVEEEAGLARAEGLEVVLGLQVVVLAEEGEEADDEGEHQEADEPVADGALREGVDAGDQAGAREQRAQDGEHEGDEDEPDVPALHHAALLLHHDGVQEGGAGEPGHQAGVFDRVPSPVAAPAQHGVGPVHAEHDAEGEEEPRDHRPAASDVDPLLAGVAHHQCAEREGKGHGEADVAEVEHRRMDGHLGILEQRVQAEAVRRSDAAGDEGEGRRGDDQQQQEEDLDRREDGRGVGGEGDVALMAQAQDEAVAGEQKRPQQQRAFLPGPQGGELIAAGERAVAVVEDVVHREVVGEGGPDEREGGAGDGDEAGETGAAAGLAQAGGIDGQGTAVGDGPEREGAREERIDTERECQQQREFAEGRHGVRHVQGRPSLTILSNFADVRGDADYREHSLRHGMGAWFGSGEQWRGRFQQIADALEKERRGEGLEAEVDVQALVLVFGLGESADDQDGDVRGELAQGGDELDCRSCRASGGR